MIRIWIPKILPNGPDPRPQPQFGSRINLLIVASSLAELTQHHHPLSSAGERHAVQSQERFPPINVATSQFIP